MQGNTRAIASSGAHVFPILSTQRILRGRDPILSTQRSPRGRDLDGGAVDENGFFSEIKRVARIFRNMSARLKTFSAARA